MISASEQLTQEYGAALKDYLSGSGEEGLKRAYDLGRRAVNDGAGLVTVVLIHQQSLDLIFRKASSSSRPKAVRRAMDFLAECLAPFDMAHRGFQDAYGRVRELNEEFEALVDERAREARDAEARFRAHVEQVPAVTYIESLKSGETVFISPQVQAMLEFTPQEWLAEPGRWAKQIHPADRDRVLADMSRFRERGGTLQLEYRLLTRSGRETWVDHEAGCVLDDAGRPRFIQGVLLDITNRKSAERGALEAETKFRRLFDRTGEAVVLADWPGGKILEANPAALRLLDAQALDVASKTLTDLVGGDRARLRAHLERAGERGEAGPDEFRGAIAISLASSMVDLGGVRALLCVAQRLA